MLSGHNGVVTFPDRVITDAALTMIIFQAPAIVAFFLTRGRPARHPLLVEQLLPDRILMQTQAGMWLNTLYLYITTFTTLVPQEWTVAPILHATFAGIGIVCAFVQARLWGEQRLNSTAKFICGFNLALQVIFSFSGLYLISGISLLVLFLISYVTACRRLPVLLIAACLPVLAVLHNGKSAMRAVYWEDDLQPCLSITDLPGFFEQWIHLGLHPPEDDAEERKSLTANLLERASLFQMLCLANQRIPDSLPYLNGETYADIPAQLVPRVVWPDKPSPHLSNSRLGIYLGLLDQEAAEKVSIAFGFIAEAYCNFGFLGVAVLGAVMGWVFKRVVLLSLDAAQFSALGLLTILLAAWSFQVELVMASWLTSFFQAAVVVIGVPMAAARFLGWR
jgi:hypothetical protein